MIFKNKPYYIILLFLALFFGTAFSIFKKTVANQEDVLNLLTKEKQFIAGNKIQLKFIAKNSSYQSLSIKSSYGTTSIAAKRRQDTLVFDFPDFIATKTGNVNWQLSKGNYKGSIFILPKTKKTRLESYFGPRSILAGGNDFSMLVVVPTDSYDNPVKDSTSVTIKYEFQGYVTEREVLTAHFISWKNIFSRDLAGDILVSSHSNGTDSKELLTEVFPHNATNFTIAATRNHPYADGNEITVLKTSVIKDVYGNIVADGTFVTFFIKTKNGLLLKTSGSTIQGIAIAKMLHPDYEEDWSIKAYVTGLAESDELTLSYLPVMKDFEVVTSNDGRTFKIGPLKSFMKQIMPDGALVYLRIYNSNNELIELKKDTSFEGVVTFHLNPDFYPDGAYSFEIETAGIRKKITNIRLW